MPKTTISEELAKKIRKITSKEIIEDGVKDLLISKSRAELIKYDTIIKEFEKKYGTTFDNFKNSRDLHNLESDVEQDFFDWEMAVTIVDELKEELRKLEEGE